MKNMKWIFVVAAVIALIAFAFLGTGPAPVSPVPAEAATTNPGPTLGNYQIVVLPISSISATVTSVVKFKAPWPVKLGCAYAMARTVSGTVNFNLVNGAGTSLLASTITASTGNVQGTLTTTTANLNIADEDTIGLNTTGTGSVADATLTLCIIRR